MFVGVGTHNREVEEECRQDRDEDVGNHTTMVATPLSSFSATPKPGINGCDVVAAVKKITVILDTEVKLASIERRQ